GGHPSPGNVSRELGRTREPQIQAELVRSGAGARAHGQIVVVDDLELQDTPPESTADLDAPVRLAGVAQFRHLPPIGLEQAMVSRRHATDEGLTVWRMVIEPPRRLPRTIAHRRHAGR